MRKPRENPNLGASAKACLSDRTFAHSLSGCPTRDWQPLDIHLNGVAAAASEFAQAFSSSDWAWSAGMLHDFGKAADEFQAYLRKENHIDDEAYDEMGGGRVNHSSAGAALSEEWHNENGRPFGRVLSYLIAGHHAGLPDYESHTSQIWRRSTINYHRSFHHLHSLCVLSTAVNNRC